MKHLHCQDLELVNVIVKLLCWLVDVRTFDKSEFETPSQIYWFMIGEKGYTYQCFLANDFWLFETLLIVLNNLIVLLTNCDHLPVFSCKFLLVFRDTPQTQLSGNPLSASPRKPRCFSPVCVMCLMCHTCVMWSEPSNLIL